MDHSIKLFAPKPIRASSNKHGVKINCLNDNIHKVNCYTPELEKKSGMTMEYQISKSIHNSIPFFKKENNIQSRDETQYFDFLKDLTEINDDSECKSEILTILRSKSDNFESTMYNSNKAFLDNSQELNSSLDLRTSMPPIRPQNPFLKNFENENENFHDCKLNYYKENFLLVNNADYYDIYSESYFYDNLGEKYDTK